MKMVGKKHYSIDGIKSFIKANIWLKSKYLFLAEKKLAMIPSLISKATFYKTV